MSSTYNDHIVPPPPYSDLVPATSALNRPILPLARKNLMLKSLPEDVMIVKFQTIVREDTEIVVGRIKVPTPGNNTHAFILRRYDTNAVSLSTMFKVAFPGATEAEEKREMDWVKSTFDTRNTNGGRGSEAVKLAGQWVPRDLALHLAPHYGLADLVSALVEARPDPNVVYRKSQRSQAAADEIARSRTPGAAVPSLTADVASPVAKRVRRQSPNVAPAATNPADDRRHLTLEATTTVTAPAGTTMDMDAEIASAKQLVLDLKRELRLKAAAGESLEDQGFDVGETSRGIKRTVDEDAGVSVSGATGSKRIIAKSKRVEASAAQSTGSKVAWSALIFGLGAAAALIPQFASNFM